MPSRSAAESGHAKQHSARPRCFATRAWHTTPEGLPKNATAFDVTNKKTGRELTEPFMRSTIIGMQRLDEFDVPNLSAELMALLRQIPCERVTTYGDLADALGSRAAAALGSGLL